MRRIERAAQNQTARKNIREDQEFLRLDYYPSKTELESPSVLYAFLFETGKVWDEFWKEHEKEQRKFIDEYGCPIYPETVMDKVFERYKWLAKQNPTITIYHQTTTEGSKQILDEMTGRMTLRPSGVDKFNGQGIYFGMSEPFNWVQEQHGGATFVTEVQINRGYPSLSGNSRQPMFMLPMSIVESVASYDPIETVRGTRLVRDWPRKSESVVIHREDQPTMDEDIEPGLKHFYFDCDSDDPKTDLWWKKDDEYYRPLNRLHPNEADLKYIEKTLGLIGTEYVEYDKEIGAPLTRIYVEETNPLLVGCVAQMVSATEIVYGRPGSPGREMIDLFKQKNARVPRAA